MPLLKGLPREDHSLVLRTDFSDDAAWDAVCREIREPVGEFRAYVDCLSDREYEGMTAERLTDLLAPDGENRFLFVVDGETFAHPEHPVLVLDLCEEPGRTFRVVPSEAHSVQSNLMIANMDFAEFADAADEDGIFRDFPEA